MPQILYINTHIFYFDTANDNFTFHLPFSYHMQQAFLFHHCLHTDGTYNPYKSYVDSSQTVVSNSTVNTAADIEQASTEEHFDSNSISELFLT